MAPQVNTSRGRACSVVRCTTVAMTLSCHLCRSSEYFPWKEWSRVALSPSWLVQEFQREVLIRFCLFFRQIWRINTEANLMNSICEVSPLHLDLWWWNYSLLQTRRVFQLSRSPRPICKRETLMSAYGPIKSASSLEALEICWLFATK